MAAKHSVVMFILVALVIMVLFIIGLRFASAEDAWLCQDGIWVRHGQPASGSPALSCRE